MSTTNKKLEIILIAVLILTAAFFRFYKISDYVVFLGDEGRDMIVMRNIFLNKDIPFLGPTASVGGFYLGPIYYWMAAPFLFITNYNPVGPSYMVAIFGLATVLLLYKLVRDTIGFWPAIFTSFLYATAPLIVRYSRSSWNPNPMPFFSLLLVYFIYLAVKNNRYIYYFGVGACFGIAIQLHYLGLVLAPLSALIILLNEKLKRIPVIVSLITIGSIITFSPFLIFEVKNHFPNFTTILEFVSRGSTVGYKGSISWAVADSANIFLEWVSKIENTPYTKLFFWVSTLIVLAGLLSRWKTSQKFIFSVGIIYLIVGVFFIRLYSGQLNDYYLGAIFPAPFIVFGLITSIMWSKKITRIIISAIFLIILSIFLSKGFYNTPPNKLIRQTEKVAGLIAEKSQYKPFNFAMISDSNSDHAYRYMLSLKGYAPTELEQVITDQLIVVCENTACSPLGHPIWEIAGFGRAQIENEWTIPEYNYKIYKLIHDESSKDLIGKPAEKGI